VFSFAKKDDQSPVEMAGLKTPMKSTRLIKVRFSLVKLFSPNPKQSTATPCTNSASWAAGRARSAQQARLNAMCAVLLWAKPGLANNGEEAGSSPISSPKRLVYKDGGLDMFYSLFGKVT